MINAAGHPSRKDAPGFAHRHPPASTRHKCDPAIAHKHPGASPNRYVALVAICAWSLLIRASAPSSCRHKAGPGLRLQDLTGLAYTNNLRSYPLAKRDPLLRQRRCAAALAKRLASHTEQSPMRLLKVPFKLTAPVGGGPTLYRFLALIVR
jgi:hypothetical protein